MVEIGGQPILWHIMKMYSAYGYNNFIICLGYKAYIIKKYFSDYFLHMSDVTFDISNNEMIVHNNQAEPWKVTLIDTGLSTMTGGRVKRVQPYIGDETFLLTYGDGVSDIDIAKLVDFHRSHGKMVTMTAIQPDGKFGILDIENDRIREFREKKRSDSGWINGGFMVLEPAIFDYIDGDDTVLEKRPFESAASGGQLIAYKHEGFWQCMDTQRDKQYLEELWSSGRSPWKVWDKNH